MQEALPAQLLSSLVLGSPGHLPVSQRLGPPQSHTVSFLGNRWAGGCSRQGTAGEAAGLPGGQARAACPGALRGEQAWSLSQQALHHHPRECRPCRCLQRALWPERDSQNRRLSGPHSPPQFVGLASLVPWRPQGGAGTQDGEGASPGFPSPGHCCPPQGCPAPQVGGSSRWWCHLLWARSAWQLPTHQPGHPAGHPPHPLWHP